MVVVQSLNHVQLCNPIDCSVPGPSVLHHSPGVCSNSSPLSQWYYIIHLILCHPILILPSSFPSIRVFSIESVLPIKWWKYWSFSFIISPSSEYSWLISFRIDWLDLLAVQGTLESFLQYHNLKASSLQPSLWSSSHIHTWLLGKWQLWLNRHSSAKWCLYLLIHCLGLS